MRSAKLRSVVLAIGLSAAVIASLAVVSAVWFFLHHREAQPASASAASAEFQQLRSRFAGEPPLLDMRLRTTVADAEVPRAAGPLHAFHTVVFDTRGGERLVKMTVPYWFGQRFARHDGQFVWLGELTFLDDTEFDPERIQLSLDRIKRHGPGLLVDYQHPSGGQFIAWVD
jgi:hypothetical protein